MKTAISLPDELSSQADRYATEHRLSRSGLITLALQEYLQRHSRRDLTARINAAIDAAGQEDATAIVSRSKAVLRNEPW